MSSPVTNNPSPFDPLHTCSRLDGLLSERIEHPERETEIDARIRDGFEREIAPLVLDMSGFSRLTQRYGIIHYLAMIRRMRKVVGPQVKAHGGMVVKFEADNAFCVFPNPDAAIDAVLAINADLKILNDATPDESDVHVCVGIGWGKILLACDDMYGNELNLAAKLGEDVAEKGEILVTDAAKNGCSKERAWESFPLTVSGVDMVAWRVR